MRGVVVATSIVLALAACTGSHPPASHPPPSLSHVGDSQVKSAMWRLARETGALREILQTSTVPDEEQRDAARGLLGDIEATIAELERDPLTAPHPILKAGLPAFHEDVRAARAALEREPPDYDPAIRLASACMRCHVVARGPGAPFATRLASQ